MFFLEKNGSKYGIQMENMDQNMEMIEDNMDNKDDLSEMANKEDLRKMTNKMANKEELREIDIKEDIKVMKNGISNVMRHGLPHSSYLIEEKEENKRDLP